MVCHRKTIDRFFYRDATSWSSQKGNIPFHYYICYSVMWANIIALQIISLLHNHNKLGEEDDGEEE